MIFVSSADYILQVSTTIKEPWNSLCFVYLLNSGIICIKSALYSALYISIQMRNDIEDDKNEDSL